MEKVNRKGSGSKRYRIFIG